MKTKSADDATITTSYVYSPYDGGWYIEQCRLTDSKMLERQSRKTYRSSQSAGDALANGTVRWTKWS